MCVRSVACMCTDFSGLCVCTLNSLYVCGLQWSVCVWDTVPCICVCVYVATNLSVTEIFFLPSKFPGDVSLLTGLLRSAWLEFRVCIGCPVSVFPDVP